MKKIKYIMLACLLTASLGMEAKSMKDLLVSMPDSMMPTLNSNLRLEFSELQEMGVKAEVKNLLGEVSVMDTLTQDFVQVRMSKVSTLQMKKLLMENGDSVICVVNRSPDRRRRVNSISLIKNGKCLMQAVFWVASAWKTWRKRSFRSPIR